MQRLSFDFLDVNAVKFKYSAGIEERIYIRFATTRDAPKWKFLAEAEQNETLGRRPNTEHVFSHFSPHEGLFCHFFRHCIN